MERELEIDASDLEHALKLHQASLEGDIERLFAGETLPADNHAQFYEALNHFIDDGVPVERYKLVKIIDEEVSNG
jgi:hypothetical protein